MEGIRSSRAAGYAALGALAAAAVVLWASFETYPQYDSLYSLLWGREVVLDGQLPGFEDDRAPTQHPLLLLVSFVLGPLGDPGARVLVLLCLLSVVALTAATFRLGRVAAGTLCGILAAVLIASRLNLWLLASIGFLDLPYIALVAWAAALEAERPRRGGAVWVLLTLAGLLRPEAWVLLGAYALWVGWPARIGGVVRAGSKAAVAPLLWCLTDLVVTGQPLFSLTHTDALALELQRERPLPELPGLMVRLLEEVVKLPVLLLAVAGAVAAVRLRRKELLVPVALLVCTCATYVVIATGGLPNVYRYLLNAGTAAVVLAAFALAGWTTLRDGSRWRTAWMVPALGALVLGAAWTVTHTSPKKARVVLEERERLRENLLAVLTSPAASRARRCGPVSVPNHKLVPDVRWLLKASADEVRARSNRALGPQRAGLAVVIDRRVERLPALDVREVPRDGGAAVLQVPPAGFVLLNGGTRDFAAYGGGC